MSLAVAEGTIQPDGTLVLDEKLNLPAGRVTVVVQPASTSSPARPLDDEFFEAMEEIWAGQKARGFVPRTVDEVERERRRLRDESEDEISAAIRLQQESRRARSQHENGSESP